MREKWIEFKIKSQRFRSSIDIYKYIFPLYFKILFLVNVSLFAFQFKGVCIRNGFFQIKPFFSVSKDRLSFGGGALDLSTIQINKDSHILYI